MQAEKASSMGGSSKYLEDAKELFATVSSRKDLLSPAAVFLQINKVDVKFIVF